MLEFAIGLQQKDTRKLGKTAIEYQGKTVKYHVNGNNHIMMYICTVTLH